MKKFLAALLAVVMVVSVASFAFAADKIDCYKLESYKEGRRAGIKIDGLKKDDKVSFYIKAVPAGDSEIEDLKIYFRYDGTQAKYDDGTDINSVMLPEGPTWGNEDGWFYVECTIQVDGQHELAVVTWDKDEKNPYEEADPEYSTYTDNYQVGECYVAGLKINEEAIDSSRVKNYNDSTVVATKTSIDAPVAPENGGEDVTEGTEDTGVVSVAVVAVAAVVGGAVVLKKREF